MITTPLSPPPPKSRLVVVRNPIATSQYTRTPSPLSGGMHGREPVGRQGTIKIMFSPQISFVPAAASVAASSATVVCHEPSIATPIAGTATKRSLTGNQRSVVPIEVHPMRPSSRKKGESRFREIRDSVFSLRGEQPPSSPAMLSPSNFDDVPRTPLSATGGKPYTRRKTILERIEGWWDLGLIRGGTIRGNAFRSGTTDERRRKETTAAEPPPPFI